MNLPNEVSEISVQELDNLVGRYAIARQRYEERKQAASEASAEADKIESEILDKLKSAGKSKFFVDGIGTVHSVSKLSFKVPKNPEDKKKLFGHIEEVYGPKVLMGLLSINSQSLNSFFKEIAETPPGLEPATSYETLSFRRE